MIINYFLQFDRGRQKMTEELLIPDIKNSLVKEWGGTIDDILEISVDLILK